MPKIIVSMNNNFGPKGIRKNFEIATENDEILTKNDENFISKTTEIDNDVN